LPGYRRYCPYTRSPTADGRWHAPDLARARRLVAASGTTGMKITVWNTPTPQANVTETRDTVTALRQLGYRASLRLLPDSTYFTYTNDSRNHAQVIDGGWGTDYPLANDFLGKLTCTHFAPHNGQATTDASELCDLALDNQIARAAQLQTTDPPAAAALWARLDHQLTNLAIWLPTVTPQRDRPPLRPHRQLPVQPGMGSPDRPAADPLSPALPRTHPAAPPRQPLPQQLTPMEPRTVPRTHPYRTTSLTPLTHNREIWTAAPQPNRSRDRP
jgi:ABC-type transport system substrate-binding protein